MEINPEKSNSRESLSVEIENFENNLKTYRDLMSKDKDIFQIVKHNSKEFMKIVDQLIIDSHTLNEKINDPNQTKHMQPYCVDHYKIIFNHYDRYFLIQKKTAQTFLKLEEQKETQRLSNIALLREKYNQNPVLESESKPKI